jgi:integrase
MKIYDVTFYTHSRKNNDGKIKVYLAYRKNRLRFKYYLQNLIYEEFIDYMGVLKEPYPNLLYEITKKYNANRASVINTFKDLNEEMIEIANAINSYERLYSGEYSMWTESKLKDYLEEKIGNKNFKVSARTKFQYFICSVKEEMKEGKILTPSGRLYRKSTLNRYKQLQVFFDKYEKSIKKNYALTDINTTVLNNFLLYLEKLDLAPDTINKHRKSFQRIINIANDREIIDSKAFKGAIYKPTVYEREDVSLSDDELEKIKQLKIEKDTTLGKAKDLFLVACYTAQSIVDIIKLSKNDIKYDNTDGRYYWAIYRQKSNKHINLLLKPIVYEIMEYRNFNLNIMVSKTLNLKVKILAQMAGLDEIITKRQKNKYLTQEKYKFITTHSGRRTFLTNLHNSGELSLNEIKEIANHSSIATTQKYLQLDEREMREKMKRANVFN